MAYLKFKFVDRAWNFCIRVQLFPPKTGFFKSKDANFWTECKQTETMRTLSASKATHCSKHTFSTFQTSSLWKFFFHPFPHTNSWRIDPHPGTPFKSVWKTDEMRITHEDEEFREEVILEEEEALFRHWWRRTSRKHICPFFGDVHSVSLSIPFCPTFIASMVNGAATFWRIKRILIISHFADVAQRRERVWLKREPNIEWEKQWKGKKAFQNSGNLPRRAEKGKHFTEIEMKTSWFSVFLTAHEKWLL